MALMDSVQTPSPSRRPRRRIAGFTLVEVVIAGGMLAILVAGSFIALTQINRWATSARLRTLALAVAQQRIDLLATTPWQVATARPAVLTAGTATENNLPLNNDGFNSGTGLSSAFTNLDSEGISAATATRTTEVTNLTARTLRVAVTVTFTYRNRPHSVSLTTLRATDSI